MPTRVATILVVEDDRAVRMLFSEVLQREGYEVIACENGAVGLEAARTAINRIDAVVTDFSMPGMKGPELLEKIRLLRRDMPAVMISGSMEDEPIPQSPGAKTVFLAKPASPGALTRELRGLLCDTM